ncbi:hypothetical protein M8J77_011891 [Diaphorina citri]|nr:hypothetical protein M8J77_011891 [Diaphorina citri]
MKSKIECYEQSVVNHLQEGLSTREIGEKLKISQSMVQRIRNGQKNLSFNNKGGRPRKLSVQDQRSLVRYLVTGRAKTTSEAAAVLNKIVEYLNYDSPPTNLKVLWERVEYTWYNTPNDYCEKLVKSMPKRLKAIKNAKGLWTKY